MRSPGRLLAAVAAVAAALAVASYLLPREVVVTREILIEAPPERVFPHVNSLQRMAAWSSWLEIDPTIKRGFSGPRQGVGNRMTWMSGDRRLGTGRQEIVESRADRQVTMRLDLDFGVAMSRIDLAPSDGGTRVAWRFHADMGSTPIRRCLGLLVKRRVAMNSREGLLRLKELVEAE